MSANVLSNHNSTWGQSYRVNCYVVFVLSSALAVVKIISFSQVGADFLDCLTIDELYNHEKHVSVCMFVHVCVSVCVWLLCVQLNMIIFQ